MCPWGWRPHKALHFTTSLERNVDVLNDGLDITLSGADREHSAGDLSAPNIDLTKNLGLTTMRHAGGMRSTGMRSCRGKIPTELTEIDGCCHKQSTLKGKTLKPE